MDTQLTKTIKQAARAAGADLIGIASRERFENLPKEESPISIFPEMRSMIVLARRVLRGSMRGIEEGTNFSSTYGAFGYKYVEDNFLSQTTYDTTLLIEDKGFEAVSLFAYFQEGMPTGIPVAPHLPAPNIIVDPYYAACAAGLGEIGLGNFFITPEYGTRQRFAFILTDADLEPDPVRDKSICSDCGACAQACPFGAIDLETTKEVGVPGHTMKVARVDYDICRTCPNGAMLIGGRGSRPDRIAAACGRRCLVQLEDAGKVGNKFNNPFRKRDPWYMDMLKRPVAADKSGNPADIGCGRNYDAIGQQGIGGAEWH